MKVVLCAIAKSESHYITEWVEYHLKLGFDRIVIYDNNDLDGESYDDQLKNYISSGLVEIIDVRGKVSTKHYGDNIYSIQIESYNSCYNRYCNEYDWFFFEDIDEFICLQKQTNVKDYLSQNKFDQYNNIKLCWKYYDDNNLIRVENNNYSIKRFTNHVNIPAQNIFVKSFIRGGLDITINSPHGFCPVRIDNDKNQKVIRSCNALGKEDYIEQILKDHKIIHEGAWVNHYRFKTIEEYVMTKMNRGWPDNYSELVKMDWRFFLSANKITDEKIKFLNEKFQNNLVVS